MRRLSQPLAACGLSIGVLLGSTVLSPAWPASPSVASLPAAQSALPPSTGLTPFPRGPLNDITDVAGVRVGHVTILQNSPHRWRTGVTAILPHSGNLATEAVWAAAEVLNGNGEMTGRGPLETSGLLNSPILLTNTRAVGLVSEGVFRFMDQRYPGQWTGQLPVVAECWDGVFSAIEHPVVTPEHAVTALTLAGIGPVPQGRVGAGTGMRSFELHAGIGSASRQVVLDGKAYTVGVLVNANHSRFRALNPAIRRLLESKLGPLDAIHQRDTADARPRPALSPSSPEATPPASAGPQPRQGSIIVIIATDLPLTPTALKALAQRAALGIGAMGSNMDPSSGDFALAFSTAQHVPVGEEAPTTLLSAATVHPDAMAPFYRATVEAVTEAQVNALLASHGALTPPTEQAPNPP